MLEQTLEAMYSILNCYFDDCGIIYLVRIHSYKYQNLSRRHGFVMSWVCCHFSSTCNGQNRFMCSYSHSYIFSPELINSAFIRYGIIIKQYYTSHLLIFVASYGTQYIVLRNFHVEKKYTNNKIPCSLCYA